jgi:tetratricopeptide (TPR) repeat protein
MARRATASVGSFLCAARSVRASVLQAFEEAVVLHRQGRLEEAERRYGAALKIDRRHFGALHYLGVLRAQQGRFADAIELMRQALLQNPRSAEAHEHLARAFNAVGRPGDAIVHLERALALNPSSVALHNDLGSSLSALGRLSEAMPHFERATELGPGSAEAYNNLGNTLSTLGRNEEAIACYATALALRPDFAAAHANLGGALHNLDRNAEAIACYDAAVARAADYAMAYYNRGIARQALNQYDAAIADYERARALDPTDRAAPWNECLARLTVGDFAIGWKRWRGLEGRWGFRRLPQPLWLGDAALSGKTILLYPEQGMGDAIQFVRYAALLAERGAQVVLELPPALAPLLTAVPGVATVVAHGEALPRFNVHAPLCCLPAAFATTLETIPRTTPYLAVPAAKRAQWRAVLPSGRKRVGLVWAGDAKHGNDRHRSMPLAALRPLLELTGFRFVALQKALRPGDATLLEAMPDVLHIGDRLADFSDTAAIIAELDLVITVDTAVAHLAGALGKPVWILLPFSPDWRWLLDRDDSPWYPTARLFRQSIIGDWANPVDRIRQALFID